MANFYTELIRAVLKNQHHNYRDNFDTGRFGAVKKNTRVLKSRVRAAFNRFGYFKIKGENASLLKRLEGIGEYLPALGTLYEILSDEDSKSWLIDLLAFRLMRHKKVKLRINTGQYWRTIRQLDNESSDDVLDTGFRGVMLPKHNLAKRGYPLELYTTAQGLMTLFILKQYQYTSGDTFVGARPGDVMIDAGGCWGDTALLFAHEVGEQGRVFSFEFIDSNAELFNRNVALNRGLEDRITLIRKPLWDVAGCEVAYADNGPASTISFDKKEGLDKVTATATIDGLVADGTVPRVDFIKMDIEGAEPKALKGAVETLRTFKPDLAISVYHSVDDLVNIPAYLNSLDLGYRFYLSHFTIHHEETVLFATVK